MSRIQTSNQVDAIVFTRRDGTQAVRQAEVHYNGREYYFLAGFYYDLEQGLEDYIFGRRTEKTI